MAFLKFMGAFVGLSALVVVGAAAYLAFTPVTKGNVGMRLSVVCQAYRLAANSGDAATLDLAWARHVDCGCVLANIEKEDGLSGYADYLEELRQVLLENTTAMLQGKEPVRDPAQSNATLLVVGNLPVTVARCQRAAN